MLIKPTAQEAEKYIDFAYELALDPCRSGYPTYIDGIKTKTDFLDIVHRSLLEERDHRILLYQENGKTAGLICYFSIPEEFYLQTVVFSIEGSIQSALEEFKCYCCKNYPGYELYLGFPKDNQEAVAYFKKNRWSLLEHSYNDVLHFADYEIEEADAPVARVTRVNFADFRKIHGPVEGDMYWNCDRLLEKLDEWNIWLYYKNNAPTAAIYYTNEKILMEIFGVDFAGGKFDADAFRKLVRKVLNDCKASGCKHMVFMNDEESQKSALDMGFHCVGEYLLFVKKV